MRKPAGGAGAEFIARPRPCGCAWGVCPAKLFSHQAGASFESRPQRFERFAEDLDTVTRLLAGNVVTWRGRHFDGRRATFRDVESDEHVRQVRAAGADRPVPPEIDLAVHECQVLPRPDAVIARLSAHHGIRSDRIDSDRIDSIPSFLIGSAEHVTEVLLARRERWGAARVTIPESAVDGHTMAPVVAGLSGT